MCGRKKVREKIVVYPPRLGLSVGRVFSQQPRSFGGAGGKNILQTRSLWFRVPFTFTEARCLGRQPQDTKITVQLAHSRVCCVGTGVGERLPESQCHGRKKTVSVSRTTSIALHLGHLPEARTLVNSKAKKIAFCRRVRPTTPVKATKVADHCAGPICSRPWVWGWIGYCQALLCFVSSFW